MFSMCVLVCVCMYNMFSRFSIVRIPSMLLLFVVHIMFDYVFVF